MSQGMERTPLSVGELDDCYESGSSQRFWHDRGGGRSLAGVAMTCLAVYCFMPFSIQKAPLSNLPTRETYFTLISLVLCWYLLCRAASDGQYPRILGPSGHASALCCTFPRLNTRI